MKRFSVYKIGDETWFLGIYSNSYKDREDEYLSLEGHKEYKEWVDTTDFVPQIVVAHMPSMPDRFWYTVYMMYENGTISVEKFNEIVKTVYKGFAVGEAKSVLVYGKFALVLGKIFPEQEGVVNKLINSEYNLGMSHGFIPLEINDRIISKYRTFEFTILPDEWAANALTQAVFYGEDVMGKQISEKRRNFLREVFGDDFEKMAEERLIQASELLDSVISSKDLEEEAPEEVTEEQAEETPEVPEAPEEAPEEEPVEEPEGFSYQVVRSRMYEDFKLNELGDVLKGYSDAITGLTEQLTALEAQIKDIKRTEDEKIADAFSARSWINYMPRAFNKASEDEQELVKRLKDQRQEDEKEAEQAENILNVGLWHQLGFSQD